MDPLHRYNGGSWMMIPTHSSVSNNQQQQQQDLYALQPQFQKQVPQQQPPQQQQLPVQQQQHPSLASHFHILPLVEKLADAIDTGNRDQQYEQLVSELTNQFKRCQQLLDSISGTIRSKSMTVEGQKHKLDEVTQQLNQRRDLIAKYRSNVEELVKPEN